LAVLSKAADEYSIHSVSLDGDEFGIVGRFAHDYLPLQSLPICFNISP
jgi:hypothetical protein